MVKLQELFNDLVAKQPQTVSNMTMIPLCSPTASHYADVGTTDDLFLERDVSYNSLVLNTRAANVTIVPQGMAWITKEAAQDRAVPSTHLVWNQPKQVGAFCIQSSQCGLMRKTHNDARQLRLLPLAIRYEAYLRRNESDESYSSLWEKLEQYNRASGVDGDYLVSFFRQYARDLCQFVAQFELVANQRGAIILINDHLAGIEVAPNSDYFAGLFQPLIRDCYGAEALIAREKATPSRANLLPNVTSLEMLMEAVQELANAEIDAAQQCLAGVERQTVSSEVDHTVQGLEVVNMNGTSLAGQAVATTSERRMIYASLMSKPGRC